MPGLRDIAATDNVAILEDDVGGFGWPITVTDPDGTVGALVGMSNDIAQVIDPDTGVAVSGRSASVSIAISSLTAEGLGLPVGIADKSKKPWLVAFDDINGNAHTFKVQQSNPDRTIGDVVCLLEAWE